MRYRIGYATSVDGSHWQLHRGNPILEVYAGPSENILINSAFVVLNNGRQYELWYLGGDAPDVYATSADGLAWQKTQQPILPKGPPGSWDAWVVSSPTIMVEDGRYKMWYSGLNIDETGWRFAIGYAAREEL
jgi:uncharacterized protein YbdZ (MbtH family)